MENGIKQWQGFQVKYKEELQTSSAHLYDIWSDPAILQINIS